MDFSAIDILFLPAVFLIGIVTSIEDIRSDKIRNKWILFGLIYGIVALAGLFVWNLVAEPVSQFFYTNIAHLDPETPGSIFKVRSDIFWKVGLNSFFSLLLGYILWKKSVLSAGDAKLFFVYALLIPTKYYWRSYFPFFPAIALFINMFVVVLMYFILRSCAYKIKDFFDRFIFLKNYKKPEKIKKKKPINWKKIIFERLKIISGFTVIILTFYFIVGQIFSKYSMDLGSFQSIFFVILIIYSRKLVKVHIKNKGFIAFLLFGLILCIYGFLTDFGATLGILARTLRMMVIFMTAFSFLSRVVDVYVDRTSSLLISMAKLEPRMVIDKIFLQNMMNDKGFNKKGFGEVLPGGLNAGQVRSIKKWSVFNKVKEVLILKKFPFAFWMFIAVIVTLITKSSVVNLIITMIRG